MPDSSTVALVSVVVAGVTAIAAPALTGGIEGRREARRAERERRSADLLDLRDLLDEMAVALEEARLGVRRIRRIIGGFDEWTEELAREELLRFIGAGRDVTRLRARIMVRLGATHEVAEESGAAVATLRRLALMLEDALDPARSNLDIALIDELEQRFVAACDAYLDAAMAVVGSDFDP